MRIRKPTPSFAVAVGALVVSLGGTSYAATQIGSADIRNDSVRSVDVRDGTLRSVDVENGTLRSSDIRDGTIRRSDLSDGALDGQRGPRGLRGPAGPQGAEGEQGPAGVGRWALVNAAGQIEAQSGGFSVAAAYPVLGNTATPPADNSQRAAGNVYINANEDLSDNGVIAVVALQNQVDQNNDGVTSGRAPGADANPEFSGEISTTQCGIAGVVGCAPAGTNNATHFVVSPRNSDGSPTTPDTRKRFYVVITGDSSDLVAP